MKRTVLSVVLCAAVFCNGSHFSHAASGVQAGLWEMTMETRMEGLPVAMPPVTAKTRQCLTPGDAVPKNDGAMKNCIVKNQKISGSKASWEFECADDQGTAVGRGEMTYSGGSSSGVSKTTITSKEGDKMTATTRITGRRVDVCPPGGVPVAGSPEAPGTKELLEKAYSAKERPETPPATDDTSGGTVEDQVKKLKSLFDF